MPLRRHLVANYGGQGWAAVMTVAFIPLYIDRLGIEAYGVIGAFAALQAWLVLLEFGMSPAINREMARLGASVISPLVARDLLRSVEWLCILAGGAIVLLLAVLAPWIARDWLRPALLAPREVETALRVAAFVIACRLLEAVYHGALLGLQRQVSFNAVHAALATVRWGGAAVILHVSTPTLTTFFAWQGAVSALSLVVLGFMVYRALPAAPRRGRPSAESLRSIAPFAGGVVVTAVLTLLLTQLDKLLLSRLLPLEEFGYYALASVLAAAITQLAIPITQACYPRMTHLATAGDDRGLASEFHTAAQLVSVATVPCAMLLVAFGESGLLLWTSDARVASHTAPLLALLAIGTLLNAFMHVPYTVQLAAGWSGFAARVNLVAAAVLVPALLWTAPRYGAPGVAFLWIALNAGYVAIASIFMHRRLLTGERREWLRADLMLPAIAGAVPATVSLAVKPAELPALAELGWITASAAASIGAAVCMAPRARRLLSGSSPDDASPRGA